MKTYPPAQECQDIGTSKDSTEEGFDESLNVAEKICQGYVKNKISNECQNSSESDTLIICPGLASSFQTPKPDKHKLSPGHYLQKAFLSSVAQKFRSKSLPNCFEKRKHIKEETCDTCDDINETSTPLVESVGLDVKVSSSYIDTKECVAESWFKTWPERSCDKVSNISGDLQCENNKCLQTEQGGIEEDTFCGINCDEEVALDGTKIHVCTLSPNNVRKTTTCVIESHSENGLDKRISPDRIGHNNFIGAISNKNHSNSKTVPLDELLDNFPLAYSPLTKQLLLIKSDRHTDTDNDEYTKVKKGDKKILNLEGKEIDIEVPGVLQECTGNPKGSECDLTATHSLNRVNTEVSSFSSTVSSLSDISPSTIEDSALGSLLDHGDNCSLVSISGCSAFSDDSIGADTKKKSLTGFLSRNVFNWKSGSKSQDSFGRWKLFGKNTSPLSSNSSLTVDHSAEGDGGSLAPDSPCSVRSSGSAARLESRVASSSALIQLDRPANLPAKSEEEQARHRAQYQQILDAAKKKEVKEAKLRKKQLQMQLKAEEQLAQAIRTWTQEILPRWDQMHTSKKAQELWWQGVPPCVRGKVWRLAIGNHLNLTHSLYNIYVQRAQDRLRGGGPSSEDDKEASMELIQLDISRTFPHLCIFQRGGPYYDMLHCLLAAYVCYRPDVGYVQGMSFIAAVLILNMEAADAFVCFANLLDQPCHRAFFHLSQTHMQAYYSTYNQLFRENLPQLHAHFTTTTLTPDLYLLDWIYTVFTKTMNLDLACRVWDVFLRDGDQFLIRTALGVLHLCQDVLLQMDFVRGSQFLTRLPDDLQGDQLFKSISCIRMTTGKLTFQDILSLQSTDLDGQGTCLS